MKSLVLGILLSPIFLFSQNQIDTSYTVIGTYKKLVKNFPFIKIVDPILPIGVNALRDISYVENDNRKLKLDIFFKDKCKSLKPAIILIHGGGWKSGNKSLTFPMALKLAEKDYVSASIEYRLSSEAIFPAAVVDIKNAVKWLKKNSEQYHVDTNKIILLGFSAGGQLASLAGFAQNIFEFEDNNSFAGYSSKVSAIINIDGLLDFLGSGSEEFDENPNSENPRAAHKWLGTSHLEKPVLWRKASSINYVNENSCPILFINSSIPRFHAGRDETIEKMKQFGIYYEVYTLENTPHSFWLFHPWFNKSLDFVLNFIDIIFPRYKN